MKDINGQFIMDGCAADDPNRLESPEQLIELLRTVGFLPLFSNSIPGFSVEEHVPASYWWTGEANDPWSWREVLAPHPEIAYGKFFNKKAGFIHKDWFPVFASYRRNGYDFDALCDDELAPYKWKNAMEQFFLDENMSGKVLPASSIPQEAVKADLQMRTYLITISFAQKRTKKGKPFGLACGQLSTPETKWGYEFVTSQYSVPCESCLEKIMAHTIALYPSAEQKALQSLLSVRVLSHASPPEKKNAKKSSFPDNLIPKLCDIPLPLSADQVAGLRFALSTLSDREQQAIIMRYEEEQPIKAVAEHFGVSSSRTQQIIAKAIRKLHHPSRLTFITDGFEKTKQHQEEIRIAGTHSDCPVASMGFSTRLTNTLLGNGLDTIAKVCDAIMHDPERLRDLPGFGIESAQELLSILKKYGVKFDGILYYSSVNLCAGKRVQIIKTGWGMISRESPLGSLDLSVRTFNGLSRAGIKTVGQFLDLTGEEKLRNIGAACWAEIKRVQGELKAKT